MSTVIKSGQIERQAGDSVRSVAFSFGDMSRQADAYIVQVRSEAAKIVEQAKAEAEEIRQQASKRGEQAALAAADNILEQKVGQQLRTLSPAIERAAAQLEEAKHTWLNHWNQVAMRTACLIAQRVIRRELSQHPDISLDVIRETLELAAGCDEIELQVSQKDFDAMGSQIEALAAAFHRAAPARIVPDSSIEPGGCRVKTKFGSIDQQITTQLQRIEEELS
ncbi:MAG: hypothetical protein KDA42_02645 [Planctomycetales bacterium]|nr:hypothetical protein [Planctomycetales bacterium]